MTFPSPASLMGMRGSPLLETYRILSEVASCGSMSRASWNLDLDVSVISRQVALAERTFGCTLFERHRRGVRLTEAGARVVEHIQHVLSLEADLQQELDDLQHLRIGSLRISATDGAIAGPFAAPIATFAQHYPGIRIELFRASSEQVLPTLRRGEAELGAGLDVGMEPGVEIVTCCHDILAAAVAPGHPLAGKKSVALEELRSFALTTFERNSGVGRALQKFMGGDPLKLTMVTNSLHAMIDLAVSGAGVALLCPHSVLKERNEQKLVIVPIKEKEFVPIDLNICVLQKQRRSYALNAFIDHILRRKPLISDHGLG